MKLAQGLVRWSRWKRQTKLAQGLVRWSRWKGRTKLAQNMVRWEEWRAKPSWRKTWSGGKNGGPNQAGAGHVRLEPMKGSNQAGAGLGPLGRWKGRTKAVARIVRWTDGRVKPSW